MLDRLINGTALTFFCSVVAMLVYAGFWEMAKPRPRNVSDNALTPGYVLSVSDWDGKPVKSTGYAGPGFAVRYMVDGKWKVARYAAEPKAEAIK